MNAIRNQQLLDEFVLEILNELHSYCTNQVSPWQNINIENFIKITVLKSPMKFKCLAWEFILKEELYPFQGIGYLKTYQVTLDENNYPHTKLVHVPRMDIIFRTPLTLQGNFRFQERDIAISNMGGVSVESNRAEIVNFPLQYIIKLSQVLEQTHKCENITE